MAVYVQRTVTCTLLHLSLNMYVHVSIYIGVCQCMDTQCTQHTVTCTLSLTVYVHVSMSVYGNGLRSASLQTLEFIANMQEGEKVLIFTGRKTT